jgi:S-formylglutathione hydrolase FrmB
MAWQRLTITSEALRGNSLGDPHERPLFVWAPPAGSDRSRRYPTIYVLHAHMRSAPSWFNVTPFERSYPQEIEQLAPPAVVVLVDGWTSVGGSQWVDSDGIGKYATYLCDEVVPFVDDRFPTVPEARHRALQGKSSGGYGAVVNVLRRPNLFGAFACHSGDALFDVTLARGCAAGARALRDRWGGSFEQFWSDFQSLESDAHATLVELYAAALAWGDGTLPFDVETGELAPAQWRRWLEHDPVRMASDPSLRRVAKRLQGAWIDAGNRDEYFLDLGATALRRAFARAGMPDELMRFELFDGGHGGTGRRYPLALAWLAERLAP